MFGQPKRVLEVPGIPDALREVEHLVGRAGREDDSKPLLFRTSAPWIDVAQGDEVEHVVGVHVADNDGVQLIRMVSLEQLRDDARTDVDEHARAVTLDEIAGASLSRIRSGRRAPDAR